MIVRGSDHALLARRRQAVREARLYFVCEGLPGGRDPEALLEAALGGGVDLIQLREKAPRCAEEVVALAQPFRRAAERHGALFLLNDHPELVGACGADGVHVGQHDLPVSASRRLLGPSLVLRVTARDPGTVLGRERDGATYMGVGSAHAATTKPRLPRPVDLSGMGRIEAAVGPPVIAIVGVTPRVPALLAAGAHAVAVIGAVSDAEDPHAASEQALRVLETAP